MWVTYGSRTWEVAHLASTELAGDDWRVTVDTGEEEPPEEAERTTLARLPDDAVVHIAPSLADRPVVARPETRFLLQPDERVVLYVTTPLWAAIAIGAPDRELLVLPTHRPTDTWFGPSTRVGELCYASRTQVRLRREDVTRRPTWALTAVALHNAASSPLLVERLKLPVPSLSLFSDSAGVLWTESVAVRRERDGRTVEVHVERRPPEEAGAIESVAPARGAGPRNRFAEALHALLA